MSNVQWAPRLPPNWDGASLRWLAEIYAGGTPDKGNQEFWTDGTIPWLNSGSVNDWSITKPSALITSEAYASSSAKWISAGSVVIALAGQGKTKGMAARLEFESTCNQSMAAVTPGPKLEYRFLQFWLSANYQNIRNMAGGDKRDGLNLVHIGSIEVPLPPLEEQQAIADYLDRETQRIDELIAEQRDLIETLRERRMAQISSSVLGVSCPVVGVDRPEVGDQWAWVPFLRVMLGRVDYRGATPVKTEEGVRLLTARNVRDGYIDYDLSVEHIGADDYEKVMRRGIPEVDDLLFTMEAPLGSVALVDKPGIALAQRIVKFRIDPNLAMPKFVMYQMLGRQFRSQLDRRATGSTALGIKASKLSGLSLALPPLGLQREIVANLNEQTSRTDALIAESEDLIALSQERRAALITAAVTGQIDVRTAA